MGGTRRLLGRAGAGTAAGLLGVLALGSPAPAAPAAPAVTTPAAAAALPGEWWWDAMGVDALHEQGTGSGITVAVVDGPIDPDVPELRGRVASTTSECLDPDAPSTAEADPRPSTAHGPEAEHATSMAALIAGTGRGTGPGGRGIRGIAPDATIRHYAVLYEDTTADDGYTCGVVFPTSDDVDKSVGLAIGQAARDGADVISVSLVGQYSTEMVEGLLTAYREVAVVVAGTGNARDTVEWPGLGNGVVLVNPVDRRGRASDFAARSPHIGLAAPGEDVMAGRYATDGWHSDAVVSGASISTALVSGGIADVWSAHPEASAGQILQAVRRTPGLRPDPDGTGFATWFRRVGEDLPQVTSPNEFYGWGIFDPADAVAVDPSGLPRTNPFVRDEVSAQPSADEVASATAAAVRGTASADPSESPSAPPASASAATSAAAPRQSAADRGSGPLPLVLAGVGVLAALGAGGAWFARRGRRGPSPDPGPPHDPGPTEHASIHRTTDGAIGAEGRRP